jgi:hypothetical protein
MCEFLPGVFRTAGGPTGLKFKWLVNVVVSMGRGNTKFEVYLQEP